MQPGESVRGPCDRFPDGLEAGCLHPGREAKAVKVLIIEDSSFTRGLMRRDLTPEHEVFEESDGLAGLTRLVELDPDLVIVDLLMPCLDGFEFLRRARETGFSGPIVVCSANTQSSIEERVRELGGSTFVAKPELLVPGRTRQVADEFAQEERQERLHAGIPAGAEDVPPDPIEGDQGDGRRGLRG